MEFLLLLVLLLALGFLALVVSQRTKSRELAEREEALAPVLKLAFEDVTAFGEDLAKLDVEIAGHVLDEGATADYQRALDTYDSAKLAGDSMREPDDIRKLTEIIEDGRYAIACVRARVGGESPPLRRGPCFFDPRHGPSVADVPYLPPNGVERLVPTCALDTERLRVGAEPHTRKHPGRAPHSLGRELRRNGWRKVLVGGSRVPYWDGRPAYQPYAAGYFGADALTWLFVGSFTFDAHSYGDKGGDHSDAGGFDAGGDF